MLISYYGTGRGKTTAALGAAVRYAGHRDNKAIIISFLKKPKINYYGESKFLYAACKQNLVIKRFGADFIKDKDNIDLENSNQAYVGWLTAREALTGNDYGMIVLDEFSTVLNLRMLDNQDRIIKTVQNASLAKHVIVTGREPNKILNEEADMITLMLEIEHPFNEGVPASEGIEF